MRRAKHSLSHYRMVTAKMGELFPVACVPVLPGDTIQHSTQALVRVSPLNTPVMHPTRVRLHHFFVPNRIVWPKTENGGWEEFITGGPDGLNAQVPPAVSHGTDKKQVTCYLGVPPIAAGTRGVNELPLRAFNLIYNEYYRDQDLLPERDPDNNVLPVCAWEKDYFSVARPFTQKGADVSLPLGDQAPIHTAAPVGGKPSIWSTFQNEQHFLETNDASGHLMVDTGTETGKLTEMYADLTSATGINVNDLRAALSIQRYKEARARYGSRFTEYLRYLGITPSDQRLNRPEFLSGGSQRLRFSEVLQTAGTSDGSGDGVGDLYGHGIAGVKSARYRKFFEEHGYVITMMSVRPKSIYENGVPKEFLKTTKEDYFQRELANLGQQEVDAREVYFDQNAGTTFGYTDRYDEYRGQWSQVSQDFRDLLNSWHMARELTETTTLNSDFINCVPSSRIFQSTSTDPLWIMVNHKIVARRMVPKRANPRIL